MTSSLPRIAIPEPTSTDKAYNQRSFPQYVHAVEAAGGIAVPISLEEPSTVWEDRLASCAAILLPGSPADVDPIRYGQEAQPETAPKDVPRERADNLLLRDAFAQAKPILGICYGLQSLNVWRRGTLIQNLPNPDLPHSDLSRDFPHADTANSRIVNHAPGRTVERAHAILVKPGSRLSSVWIEGSQKETEFFVNSSHHQAVDHPGESLIVVATSPLDGVIEAVEGAEPSQFVVGVQWHPERTFESSAASRALFAAFLDAARSWKPLVRSDA
jgi:putative glutamine amidotransferase